MPLLVNKMISRLIIGHTNSVRHLQMCPRMLGKPSDQETMEIDEALETRRFKVLEITKARFQNRIRPKKSDRRVNQPREKSMLPTQDWGSVWPVARSFHPATVPLPIHMGTIKPKQDKPHPYKYANAELMKIPNFLHLVPPVIKRQCEAIKNFNTKFPDVEDIECVEKEFPVIRRKYTYLNSKPSIRDERARIVQYEFNINDLELNDHATDKILRMVDKYFDVSTDTIKFVADRCPLSSQNFDFCEYLTTALYFESQKTEDWEADKNRDDNEMYIYEGSPEQEKLASVKPDLNKEIETKYAESIKNLHDEGESKESLDAYKDSVLAVYGLK